jgi:hypothetical protein
VKEVAVTIDEAIEKLNHLPIPLRTAHDHANFEAVKLGVEALKYIQRARQHDLYVKPERLLGETK